MPDYRVTAYERQHRNALLTLIYENFYSHSHLDWYGTEYWLDHQSLSIALAWRGELLVGALGASVPLNGTSWLRLMAMRDDVAYGEVLHIMWETLRDDLVAAGNVDSVWLLASADWLLRFTPLLGMNQTENIVTMRRVGRELPLLRNPKITITPAELEDLPTVERVDQSAFHPPWQMTLGDLRQAMRISASFTVARYQDEIIGYEITTRHRENAHLARLAVFPQIQSSGVGGALLHNMIDHFTHRGVLSVTVNTQSVNLRSQRLYGYYGFRRNGYDMPVFSVPLR